MKKSIKIFSLILILFGGIFIITGCNNKVSDKDRGIISKGTTEPTDGGINGPLLKINTEGLGQIKYYIDENNKTEFSDEYPAKSAATIVNKDANVTVEAKADTGWKFVKWTIDGKDYSNDIKTDVKVSIDTELVAVFEKN